MSLTNDSPRSSQLSVTKTLVSPDDDRRRSPSVGIGETLSTYHIIANAKNDSSNLEIQLKGRTALLAKTMKPAIGSPSLQLTTPKVDGESVVATAKLQPSSGQCKIMLGDPNGQKAEWTQVQHTADAHQIFIFEHNAKRYLWRRKIHVDHNSIHQTDLELVAAGVGDTVLATYLPNRIAVSRNQIARLDFLVDLDPELQILCLMSVLGARQSSRMEDAFWGVASKFRKKEKGSLGLSMGGYGATGVAALSLGGGGGC